MHASGVTVEQLPPRSKLKRNALPIFAVRYNGKVIGRVETKHIGGARNTFYFAFGLHPDTGEEYRLEGSIYFDERVDAVRRFHLNPLEFQQHLGI
jgi:hypothetical protein